jgi:exo-beta-1,3-glucanase (GH17 family)
MRKTLYALLAAVSIVSSCVPSEEIQQRSASEILGNPDFPAIAYGGYRHADRSNAPSIEDIKEDLRILDALGIKILRTYHARLYQHTPNLLQAIKELKTEQADFEMYVMLGVWIQCEGAWSAQPLHNKGDKTENKAEIDKALSLAQAYPDIVKVIAVGNEAMVHWAATYYVHPRVILKWVNYLQDLKEKGSLDSNLWITSSDNFASWGGGDNSYHLPALDSLIRAVDYLSVHSYPFHDTHYQPEWWWSEEGLDTLPKFRQIKHAVNKGVERFMDQIGAVKAYRNSLNVSKPLHVGETGWASMDNEIMGDGGSAAADEYKQALYYQGVREYCQSEGMASFYFEAFDEPWKKGDEPLGSENHFGLISVDGLVKMPLWPLFEIGSFSGLRRLGKPLRKSLGGNEDLALALSSLPPLRREQAPIKISQYQEEQGPNESKEQDTLVLFAALDEGRFAERHLPNCIQDIEAWEGTCKWVYDASKAEIQISTGTGDWWGGALRLEQALDLSDWKLGSINFEIKGHTSSSFLLGIQSGVYDKGTLEEGALRFGPNEDYQISEDWQKISAPLQKIKAETDFVDIRSLLFVKGLSDFDGQTISIRRVFYTRG